MANLQQVQDTFTDKRLSTITYSVKDIGKIFWSLDHDKAHGHNNLSIRMLKLRGDAMCKPLDMIFNQSLISGVNINRKSTKIVPILIKGHRQTLSSLLAPSL